MFRRKRKLRQMFVGSVCLSVCLPYKEETVEQRSFHSVSHFEECLLSVTMYSEFHFWELHKTHFLFELLLVWLF